MSSSRFTPLFGAPASAAFRRLGDPEPVPPTPDDAARRAFDAGYARGCEESRREAESIAAALVRLVEAVAAFRARLKDGLERERIALRVSPDVLALLPPAVRASLEVEPVDDATPSGDEGDRPA